LTSGLVKKVMSSTVATLSSLSSVGAIVFSSEASMVLNFTTNLADAANYLQENIPYELVGGATLAHTGFALASKTLSATPSSVPTVVITLTDGYSLEINKLEEVLNTSTPLADAKRCVVQLGPDVGNGVADLISEDSPVKLACGSQSMAMSQAIDAIYDGFLPKQMCRTTTSSTTSTSTTSSTKDYCPTSDLVDRFGEGSFTCDAAVLPQLCNVTACSKTSRSGRTLLLSSSAEDTGDDNGCRCTKSGKWECGCDDSLACTMFTQWQGSQYLYSFDFGIAKKSYKDAEAFCVENGAHLASVSSKEENEYIAVMGNAKTQEKMGQNLKRKRFLGVRRDRAGNGTGLPNGLAFAMPHATSASAPYAALVSQYADCTPDADCLWQVGADPQSPNPNDYLGKEDCVVMHSTNSKNLGAWADVRCTQPEFFVCERPAGAMCSLDRELVASEFGPYVGYAGALSATGTVRVQDNADKSLTLTYDLQLDEADAAGGVHIHVGMDCNEEAGAHYFSSDVSPDPWSNKWSSDSTGAARGTVRLDSGFNYDDNLGHTVVIHAASGEKIACGILGGSAPPPPPTTPAATAAPPTTLVPSTTVQRCEGVDGDGEPFSYERKDDPICANAAFSLCSESCTKDAKDAGTVSCVRPNLLIQKFCPVLCKLNCTSIAAAHAEFLLLNE